MHKIIVAFILTWVGCSSFSDERTEQENSKDSSAKNIALSRHATNDSIDEYEQVAYEFYKWYLDKYYNGRNDIFEPRAVLNSQGYYSLDTARYYQILRESDFFSTSYFNFLDSIYRVCNAELITVDTAEVEECGCNPAEFTKNCQFTFYLDWLYHQGELTEGVKVISSSTNGLIAQVQLCLIEQLSNPDFCVTNVIVTLGLVDNHWRISRINRMQ